MKNTLSINIDGYKAKVELPFVPGDDRYILLDLTNDKDEKATYSIKLSNDTLVYVVERGAWQLRTDIRNHHKKKEELANQPDPLEQL